MIFRKSKTYQRIISKGLAFSLLLTVLNPINSYANPEGGEPTTSQMSTSMINFFRDDRIGDVDAGKVSKDEYLVYGVFLSNFFIPGQTTVKDLKGGDTKLAQRVTNNFFGTEGVSKSVTVGNLNAKLYEGLLNQSNGLGSEKTRLQDSKGKPLTGASFMTEISKKGKLKINGKTIDLSQKGMRGALQILMGVVPKVYTNAHQYDAMYMDGLGNVWASYKPKSGSGVLSVEDYVLVLPACLNPITFKGTKLPLVNSFGMGAIARSSQAKIDGNSDTDIVVPYYDVLDSLVEDDTLNMLNIYGIHSPSPYVGNTNSILKNGSVMTGKALTDKMKVFLSKGADSTVAEGELRVMVTVKMGNIGNYEKTMKNIYNNVNGAGGSLDKEGFAKYFGETMVYAPSEIDDNMHFFNSSKVGASGDGGNFNSTTLDDLVPKHRLFMKDVGGGNYSLYSNSVKTPRFVSELSKVYKGEASVINNEHQVYFLKNGKFKSSANSVITNTEPVLQAFGYGTDKARVYGVGKVPSTVNKFNNGNMEGFWSIFNGLTGKNGTVPGMTYMDTALSAGALNISSKSVDLEVTKTPYTRTGGLLKELNEGQQNSVALLYHTLNTYRLFSIEDSVSSQLTGTSRGKLSGALGDIYIKTDIANDVNNWQGIYWGYLVSLLGASVENNKLQFTGWSNSVLPDITINTSGTLDSIGDIINGGVSSSENLTNEQKSTDILDKVYGILSETQNSYRNSWIKSTIDGIFLTLHRNIVGSWVGSDLTVGTGGTYTSSVGYISTPSLTELPFTAWVLQDYGLIYMFFLLIVLMLLIMMVITNNRTVNEAILTFLIMGVVLIIPQTLVVNIVDLSNRVTDKMYSEKFNFWAISQHQEDVNKSLVAEGSTDDIGFNFTDEINKAKEITSKDARVRIKWMSPKKEDEFDKLFSKKGRIDGLDNNLTLFKMFNSNILNQEEYNLKKMESDYVYRPYNSIANSASESYNAFMGSGVDVRATKDEIQVGKGSISGVPPYRYTALMGGIKDTLPSDVLKKVDTFSVSEPNTDYRYWGLGNASITKAIFKNTYSLDDAGVMGYSSDEESDAYFLLTESPYYYFYNVLKSRYSEVNGGFKNALLEKDVFKVSGTGTRADGKLRDFLDFEGLYSTIVPYLKQGNEYVRGWAKKYGREIEKYDFENGSAGDDYNEKFEEAKRKKEAMKNVWMMYTPWVDGIYESTDKLEMINGLNIVEDPMSPGAYAKKGSRRMVFSPAEMYVRGYNVSNITDAEYRTQKVLESTYEDLMYLVNYYDFNDEVLLSMASMMATFNFNREFSQVRVMGEGTKLYPQNFEMKNFNYDAFMRLMLINATGEPLKTEKGVDLYERVLSKSSSFTGMWLVLTDIMGVVIIPTIKILVLCALLLLSILIALSCALAPPDKLIKKVVDVLLKPIGLLFITLIGFSWVMTLFMGEGYTSYVGAKTVTFGVTDPNILLMMVTIISTIFIVLLVKILFSVCKSIKTHGLISVIATVGTVASVGGSIVNTIKGGTRNVSNGVRNAKAKVSSSKNSRDAKNRAEANSSYLRDIADGLESIGDAIQGGSQVNQNAEDKSTVGEEVKNKAKKESRNMNKEGRKDKGKSEDIGQMIDERISTTNTNPRRKKS